MIIKPTPQSKSFHLIQTKLYRPPAAANLVSRPRLLARLTEGLQRHLILISAPPGFGKTTLASQWLDNCSKPYTWLSLDEGDNDLPQLLRYVCAAVRRTYPEACTTLQDLLSTGNLPDPMYLANLLIEELNALPAELILVLDDYQHIHSSQVHSLLRRLLRYRPPRLHLVILTRSDPPLYLGRLRLSQQLTEIRASDLRFGLTETRLFLREHTDHALDETVIQFLHTRTEGWIIGLQLAGISLQHHAPAQFLARFGGSHRLLEVYLIEEVLANLTPAMTEFLTRTALLDRFCAPLGDALLAHSPWSDISQNTIAQLEAQNLFVIPLDEQGTWFRYHDLFRDFLMHRLKRELSQDDIAQLHRRAGVWLAEAGLIEDALRHFIAAGDETAAADLVEDNLHPLFNQRGFIPILTRWLNMFPEQAFQTHLGLRVAQLCLFGFRWDLAALAASVEQSADLAQADLTTTDDRQRSRLALFYGMWGYLLYHRGQAARSIPLFQNALNAFDHRLAYAYIRAQGIQFLVRASVESGQRESALALLRTALAEATTQHRPEIMILLVTRVIIQLYAGELDDAAATAERALALVEAEQTQQSWSGTGFVQVFHGWALYYLGSIRYEQNDLEAAAWHWQQIESMRYQINPGAFHDSLVGLALIAQLRGQVDQALTYAQSAQEFASEMRSPLLLLLSDALAARLALLNGDPTEALRRTREIDTSANQGNAHWLEPLLLTVVRARLAEATPDALAAALELAGTCLHRAENAHNTRQVIQSTAFQALIWHALRRSDRAFDALHRTLMLAESNSEQGAFVRTFLDLGAPMAELLQQFDQQHNASTYTKHLLAAFAKELGQTDRRDLTAQYVQLYNITPLTPRELELLALIGQRLTIKEMAEQLVISPNTVKTHMTNIYTKLGVNNRHQAVAKARDIGLLPPG